MYYTKQVYFHITKKEQAFLLNYEQIFITQIDEIVTFMTYNGTIPFSKCCFHPLIHRNNQMYVYQLALRKYLAMHNHKKFQFSRSACFVNRANVFDSYFVLKFGNGNRTYTMTIYFEEVLRMEVLCDCIRIDVVHEQAVWYANLICKKK